MPATCNNGRVCNTSPLLFARHYCKTVPNRVIFLQKFHPLLHDVNPLPRSQSPSFTLAANLTPRMRTFCLSFRANVTPLCENAKGRYLVARGLIFSRLVWKEFFFLIKYILYASFTHTSWYPLILTDRYRALRDQHSSALRLKFRYHSLLISIHITVHCRKISLFNDF